MLRKGSCHRTVTRNIGALCGHTDSGWTSQSQQVIAILQTSFLHGYVLGMRWHSLVRTYCTHWPLASSHQDRLPRQGSFLLQQFIKSEFTVELLSTGTPIREITSAFWSQHGVPDEVAHRERPWFLQSKSESSLLHLVAGCLWAWYPVQGRVTPTVSVRLTVANSFFCSCMLSRPAASLRVTPGVIGEIRYRWAIAGHDACLTAKVNPHMRACSARSCLPSRFLVEALALETMSCCRRWLS